MFVDIGVNLTDEQFNADHIQVINRAIKAKVSQQIVIGSSMASSQQALELCANHAGLFATVGIHPHDSKEYQPHLNTKIIALAKHPKVVACGEMGLDFFRDFSPRSQQELAFIAQLELAADTIKKPVYLHERDAFKRLHPILKDTRDLLTGAVIHCFTGSKEALYAYLDLDCYIGISGWVCDERRGRPLQELIPHIPLERLLVETDAPYLIPRDLPSRPTIKHRNEPCYLPWIAKQVASLRSEPEAKVYAQLALNSRTLFNLPQ